MKTKTYQENHQEQEPSQHSVLLACGTAGYLLAKKEPQIGSYVTIILPDENGKAITARGRVVEILEGATNA